MEVNCFQILQIYVTLIFIFNMFKRWYLMCLYKMKKRIYATPAVKGLKSQCQCQRPSVTVCDLEVTMSVSPPEWHSFDTWMVLNNCSLFADHSVNSQEIFMTCCKLYFPVIWHLNKYCVVKRLHHLTCKFIIMTINPSTSFRFCF